MIAFGPVPSRRLGLSLGINNIVSHKICSYGCVYCQIGETHNQTTQRRVFYEPEVLLENVEDHLKKLDSAHQPDYLTFVANGEPTLDKNLGTEIKMLKQLGIPVAVITNASILPNPVVRDNLMEADWVSLKIDSVNEEVWRQINRPPSAMSLSDILTAITDFSTTFKGKLHTETMLVKGLNDSTKLWQENASYIASLNPETAFLSIPIRPPAEAKVQAVTAEQLAVAWQIYHAAGISVELLAGFEGTNTGYTGNAFEDILNITAVHPMRQDTMTELLSKDKSDFSVVQSLVTLGLIKAMNYNNKTYYVRRYHFK
ncbi:radical SAM protein [Geofilum sp. OHC36d9]|uniref:radical SAM protein n=1 Tax=Geofilum sp. OHC36d9 TaxID=3458413 RepID=UPI004034A31A